MVIHPWHDVTPGNEAPKEFNTLSLEGRPKLLEVRLLKFHPLSSSNVKDRVFKSPLGLHKASQINFFSREELYRSQSRGWRLSTLVQHLPALTMAPQGLLALIGRDVLQHCTLLYNAVTGEITLSI